MGTSFNKFHFDIQQHQKPNFKNLYNSLEKKIQIK